MDCEPTLVKAVTFSDLVIREQGTGKLTLVGCFSNFNVSAFPFTSPPFYATVVMANFRGKLEKVNICLRVEHESGLVLASVAAAIGTQRDLAPNDAIELPFPLPPMIFQSAGVYKAVVLVNNEIIGQRDLVVRPITATPELP